LWQRLAEVSGDPDCGLRLACRMPPGSPGVVEYVAANAATLRDGYAAVTTTTRPIVSQERAWRPRARHRRISYKIRR
jgi:hypothetical protein